jgi:iron only hydrogenase large subunit-like protein
MQQMQDTPKRGTPSVCHALCTQVTLHDCLACSGCVTSAEAVLLQSQVGCKAVFSTLSCL